MRKFSIFVAVAMAAVWSGIQVAQAQAPVVWRGVAEITVANSTCTANNWTVGTVFSTLIRPRFRSGVNDLTNNGPHTYLHLFRQFKANNHRFANRDIRGVGPFGVRSQDTAGRGGWSSNYLVQATNASMIPGVARLTTDTLSFEVTFENFDNIAGCILTIRGAGTRRG